jgi:hypothetical protein
VQSASSLHMHACFERFVATCLLQSASSLHVHVLCRALRRYMYGAPHICIAIYNIYIYIYIYAFIKAPTGDSLMHGWSN